MSTYPFVDAEHSGLSERAPARMGWRARYRFGLTRPNRAASRRGMYWKHGFPRLQEHPHPMRAGALSDRQRHFRVNARLARVSLFLVLLNLFVGVVGLPAVAAFEVEKMTEEIGIDQRLDETVPLRLAFRDEMDRAVTLAQYFGSRPVLLNLVYLDCPMLCGQVLQGMIRSLKPLFLSRSGFHVGRDFDILTISFNPTDTPALAQKRKAKVIEDLGRTEAETGWHFLTGGEGSIAALTQAIGFRYAYDEKSKQFAHASGIFILTPEGKISRVFYGIEYPTRDLRLALTEASRGKIGSLVDQLLLFCFHYDPTTGRYSLMIVRLLQIFGSLTAATMGIVVILLLRREPHVSV